MTLPGRLTISPSSESDDASTTLELSITTIASRPKLMTRSVGTTLELANSPPSSTSSATISSFDDPSTTSLTVLSREASARLRMSLPRRLRPLRIRCSSFRNERQVQHRDHHDEDHDAGEDAKPPSVGSALKSHAVSPSRPYSSGLRTPSSAQSDRRTEPMGMTVAMAWQRLRHGQHEGAGEEGPVGFEPTTRGLKAPCSAAELRARAEA